MLLRHDALFTNMEFVRKHLPDILSQQTHTDDYPRADVKVTLSDGGQLNASGGMQAPYMLPWQVGEGLITTKAGMETFNPQIARALATLMPPKALERIRFEDASLVEAIEEQIEVAQMR
jgi:hypothetical protein